MLHKVCKLKLWYYFAESTSILRSPPDLWFYIARDSDEKFFPASQASREELTVHVLSPIFLRKKRKQRCMMASNFKEIPECLAL